MTPQKTANVAVRKSRVVEQKSTFARDGGFVLGFGFEQVQARDEEEA